MIKSNLKNEESKKELKPELKVADKFLDLKVSQQNVLLSHLDEQIVLRDMSIEQKFKKGLLK